MISKIINQTIWFSYLTLVITTPLLFSTKNSELFEVPKMLFVYLAATVILFMTLLKFVLNGQIQVPKSAVFISFLIFVLIQALSTFTSIDKFTSIFGYPTRLNGGLLSQFAYLIIFICALINLNVKQVKTLIIAAVLGAFAVSLWGILGHFGKDPSCLVLTGKLNSTCWQKEFDPTVRIFSTLGQPNWLASYLVLTIPLSISLLLTSKPPRQKFIFALISPTLILAFILTNSRAGTVGLILALLIFFALLGGRFLRKNFKIAVIVILTFVALGAIFGSTLYSRFYESAVQYLPAINNQQSTISAPGTDSGQIRLIVWEGAWEAFKERPILGFGPETFAYSYYLFRPLAHNNTTEWNFFYNKAHNEFLNYLATTGIVGTSAYIIFILTAIISLYKLSQGQSRHTLQVNPAKLAESGNSRRSLPTSAAKAAIAAIIGYQTTIFFGFSTVTTQLLMFLSIASILVLSKSQDLTVIKLGISLKKLQYALTFIITIVGFWSLIFIFRLYLADIYITKGDYQNAIETFPSQNPFYLSEYAYYLAESATTSDDQPIEKPFSEAEEAAKLVRKAQEISPNNVTITRRAANTFFLISDLGNSFRKKAVEYGQKLTQLAPTDPQSYLSLGKIQAGLDYTDEAKKSLEKALDLKPDYLEAQELLEQIEAKELQ